jgi:hypothetical protein
LECNAQIWYLVKFVRSVICPYYREFVPTPNRVRKSEHAVSRPVSLRGHHQLTAAATTQMRNKTQTRKICRQYFNSRTTRFRTGHVIRIIPSEPQASGSQPLKIVAELVYPCILDYTNCVLYITCTSCGKRSRSPNYLARLIYRHACSLFFTFHR